jgi:hypothetical protein
MLTHGRTDLQDNAVTFVTDCLRCQQRLGNLPSIGAQHSVTVFNLPGQAIFHVGCCNRQAMNLNLGETGISGICNRVDSIAYHVSLPADLKTEPADESDDSRAIGITSDLEHSSRRVDASATPISGARYDRRSGSVFTDMGSSSSTERLTNNYIKQISTASAAMGMLPDRPAGPVWNL